jgi:hypothetical protein
LTPKLQNALRSANSAIQWIRIDVDHDPVQSFVTTNNLPTLIAFMNGQAADRLVGFFDEGHLKTFIQAIDERFVPTGTNRLRIDFDMCIALLNRPWLSDGFLSLKSWFVPGFRRGDFSDGSSTPDPGALNAIPIACVLVRNLSVLARWTTADRSALESAAHMGPFSLHGRDFDQSTGTMTVKGMQSIAWVCAKTPLLPPDSDPTLPTQ